MATQQRATELERDAVAAGGGTSMLQATLSTAERRAVAAEAAAASGTAREEALREQLAAAQACVCSFHPQPFLKPHLSTMLWHVVLLIVA